MVFTVLKLRHPKLYKFAIHIRYYFDPNSCAYSIEDVDDVEHHIRSYNLKFYVNKNQSKTIHAEQIFYQMKFLCRESNVPKQNTNSSLALPLSPFFFLDV